MKHLFKFIVGLSLAYWVLLLFSTQMLVVHDAQGYEQLGEMIHQQGLAAYFKSGPHREPLYPLSIAASMGLSSWLGVSYQFIQASLQVFFLLLTQLLLLAIFLKMKIHRVVAVIVLLYMAISPALVNTGLSLFSEILTYPFVLGAVLSLCMLSDHFRFGQNEQAYRRIILWSLVGAISFLGFMFVRGVGMVVFYGCVSILAVLILNALLRQKFEFSRRVCLSLVVLLLVVSGVLHIYKSANLHYNGQYVFTNRVTWMLYGATERRVQPLTGKDIKAGLLFAGGDGLCKKVMSEEDCAYWHFGTSDAYGLKKYYTIEKDFDSAKELNQEMVRLTFDAIQEHPFRYIRVFMIDALRHFFWESTKIGFVQYPGWLQTIYDNTLFKNAIRLSVSMVSLVAFLFGVGTLLFRSFRKCFYRRENTYLLITTGFAVLYLFFVSFVTPLTRYALPIAPLYFILVAVMLQRLWPFKR